MSKGLAALAAIAAAATFTGIARGATVIQTYPINTSAPACGGSAVQTIEGTVIAITRFDPDGNLISNANVFANYKTTFTNPTTAVSVTSVRGALEKIVISGDGSFIRMSAGLFGEFLLRGAGVVAMNTGLLVVSFDATGAVTDIEVTPTRDGPIARFICPYLMTR